MLKKYERFQLYVLAICNAKNFSPMWPKVAVRCWQFLLITWWCLLHVGFLFDFILPSEPPTFVKKLPSLVIVDEGSVLSLCCEAVGSPPPKVEWSRAGNVHSPDTSLAFQEQGCLVFNTVEFNSHGKYVCRARNRIGLAETTTAVVVKRKGAFWSIIWYAIIPATKHSSHTNLRDQFCLDNNSSSPLKLISTVQNFKHRKNYCMVKHLEAFFWKIKEGAALKLTGDKFVIVVVSDDILPMRDSK